LLASGVPGGDGEPICLPEENTPCTCEATETSYPFGVFTGDAEVATAFLPGDAEYDGQGRIVTCTSNARYAWPDCATVAEVSGTVIGDPESAFGVFSGDEDYFFNMCPDRFTMRADPFNAATMEIHFRSISSRASGATRRSR